MSVQKKSNSSCIRSTGIFPKINLIFASSTERTAVTKDSPTLRTGNAPASGSHELGLFSTNIISSETVRWSVNDIETGWV